MVTVGSRMQCPRKRTRVRVQSRDRHRMRKIGMNMADADGSAVLSRLRSALGVRHEVDTHGMEHFYHGGEFGLGIAAQGSIQVLTG